MREHLWIAALLASGLVGCAPALHDSIARDVATGLPVAYPDAGAPAPADVPPWRLVFDDADLAALIDEALANNQEILVLGQEVRLSEAEVGARRGEYLPRLRLDVGAGVEKVGRYTSVGASDADHDIEPGVPVPEALGDLRGAVEASWEVDLWGRLRQQARAARLRYLSTVEGRGFVVTQLVAEVAETWYDLLALDRELAVLDENIALLSESLEVVRLQKDAARVTELAVQRFEAERLEYQARRAEVAQRVAVAEAHLDRLCGRAPGDRPRPAARFDALPAAPLAVGVPEDLLRHRPDVRARELDLEAARLDVKAARSAFYPELRLDGGLGDQAYRAVKLGAAPESLVFDVVGGLTAPLLNRSALRAAYVGADARRSQALLEYERTVLGAYLDVRVQRARVDNYDEAYARRAEQVARLRDAVVTSNDLFQSARADYLEVLTTRRDALGAALDLIETRQQQWSARIGLYRALGGGWDGFDPAAP